MLVLLPPSETKAEGGAGAPLDLTALSFPELTPVRERLVTALSELAADVPASLAALGLSQRQADEVTRNAVLRESPTMPALERYTGVLYDALDAKSFTKPQRNRANRRLAVASALFGVVRTGDPIPAYRLSGDTVLPGVGGLRTLWRSDLEKTLSTVDELVVDLRSGAYANLAAIPHAVTVRVVTDDGAGRRKTVSHFNKAYKGRLAAALALAPREPGSVRTLISVAAANGMRLEPTGKKSLDLIVV
ncbi:peroxide stress protein YaaA [Actinokineospora xionganensis]|uniref:Peroxide stress protein YaaA n=1 Tax=Actinokineospora xionganensis TaxID=2684470 RepID=A0ABR7L9T5_9PSEU|nr:peroxide stress protein YaaA [Actinokineospora xionganensis]MBC6449352.1 peroxide stress protein YaaA [Actinokineospora xionganensis]